MHFTVLSASLQPVHINWFTTLAKDSMVRTRFQQVQFKLLLAINTCHSRVATKH